MSRLEKRRLDLARNAALLALDGLLPRCTIAVLKVGNVRRDEGMRARVTIGRNEQGARRVTALALPAGAKSKALFDLLSELADSPSDRPLFGLSEEAIRLRLRRMKR